MGSGGRGEESVAGGACGTARLQYLSAPEPCGRQPRNRHDVNDPLLLAPLKERTSNLLWVLDFLLLTRKSEATVNEDRQVGLAPRRQGSWPFEHFCALLPPTLI